MTVNGMEMICDYSILSVLRESGHHMTCSEITTAIGLGNLPKGSRRLAVDSVRDRLHIMHGRGLVRGDKISYNRVIWEAVA